MAGSNNDTVLATSNQQITNYDTSKLIIRSTRFIDAQYENLTGGDFDLKCGMLVGRITATGFIVPLDSAAIDGSEIPLGVIIVNETVANTVIVDVCVCVAGELEKGLVIFTVGDDEDTIIDGRRLGDRIMGDTLGLLLVEATELSEFDNQ